MSTAVQSMQPISEEAAESEPNNVRTFPDHLPSASFPKRSYAIAVLSPAGFSITITLNDMKLDQLEDALATLLERGYMPDEAPALPNAAPAPAAQAERAPGTPPMCPYHGPMKESTIKGKEGTYYCPKKMADDSGYCKEKWPK